MTPKCFSLAVILCVVLLLSGCAAMRPTPPEVNLIGIEVRDISLTHVNLLANLRLFNPNAASITVLEVDYTLFLNGVKVSQGQTAKPVSIGAEDYGDVDLRMSSAYWDLFQFLNRMQTGEELEFSLQGSVKVGSLGMLSQTFTFDKHGNIPLRRSQSPPSASF